MNFIKNAIGLAFVTAVMAGSSAVFAADCASLQDQKNLIMAAHGYCFKDSALQKQYGGECFTKRPSLTETETKRVAQLDEQLKAQSCPKVN